MNEVAQELTAKLKQIRLGQEHGSKVDIVDGLEIELNKWAMECKYLICLSVCLSATLSFCLPGCTVRYNSVAT